MLTSIFSDVYPLILELLILALGVTVYRVAMRRREQRVDPIDVAGRNTSPPHTVSDAQRKQHEVELRDRARATESSLQTKLAVMEKMVSQADQEIERLESMLEEIREIPTPRLAEFRIDDATEDGQERFDNSPVKPDQFIRLLHYSGYNPEEIAIATKRPLADIHRILGEPDDGQSEAA